MGSRYQGADRSTGGYQARSVDAEERESERQTVLGAFAEAVGDEGLGDRETTTEGDAASEETVEEQGSAKSANWPGEDGAQAGAEGRSREQPEEGQSGNWPNRRENISDSEARGQASGGTQTVVSTIRSRISSPKSMSVTDHRTVVNLLEQARDRGAPLAAVAGGGFDDEVHGWLSTVSGHEELTQKTKQRAKDVVGWFF
ncbi:hypothetical protein [Halocatena marina]|uniref:hypothetical protein n=1 Tax=Halocatena marina TaxID=2934937 RepID=UPI0020102C06|nr:hypothetical protein [Halocatena marina]